MGTSVGMRHDAAAEALFHEVMFTDADGELYAGYDRLRRLAPAFLTEDGTAVLSGHRSCDSALRDRRLGMGEEAARLQFANAPTEKMLELVDQIRASMVCANPPEHTRLRRMVSWFFTAPRIAALRASVARRADELLDELAERPGGDFVHTVALRLPVSVIAGILGMPHEDVDVVLPWVSDFSAALSSGADSEVLERAGTAQRNLLAYLARLLEDKRRRPGDDLLSGLVQAPASGHAVTPASPREAVSSALLLFGAGTETVSDLLGNGMRALLDHPDQLAALRGTPRLARLAVEEMLRYDSPVQIAARTVLEPALVAGRPLPAGSTVVLLLGAANRDPDRFDRPHRFAVDRADNGHLAFAAGIHFCLGAHLARLQGDVVFSRLVRRFSGIEADGTPVRRPGLAVRGHASLPVTLRPA